MHYHLCPARVIIIKFIWYGLTSRIKDYAFQINRLLQNVVKRRKIQAKKKNAKCMALQRQMESSQQRQTRLQGISAHKTICSQLETLEKRVICERAKRARHSQVCSIENRGYIYILYIVRANFVHANFVLITRKEGGA